MGANIDHKWDRIPVNQEVLAEQIVSLEKCNVLFGNQDMADDVRKALYLEWPAICEPSTRAITLGMYARWLIAAHLLLKKSGNDADLSKLLEKNNANVRQLFATVSGNRKIRDLNRYNPKANQPKGDKLTDVLKAIIAKLNEYFAKNHQSRKITVEDFFAVRVPISPLSDYLENGPIQSFEHWLETGKRQAVPESDNVPIRRSPPNGTNSQVQEVITAILKAVDECSAHRIIINVAFEENLRQITDFAADLNVGLLARRSIVWIRLSGGASRRDVLKSLYNQCQIPFSDEAFDARPIDLARDLKQIRDYLTAEPVVVVFRDWDNVGKTFEALHDYLCNTHWGELIRILAQPSQEWLLSSACPLDPQYRIVVLSAHIATDLKPWATWSGVLHVDEQQELAGLASKFTDLGEDKVAWYHRYGKYLGVPGKIEIFLISTLSASALEELGNEYRAMPESKSRKRAVRVALMRKWLADFKPTAYELCFLKYAAVSINGMRRSTMYRCIKQLEIVTGLKFDGLADSEFDGAMESFLRRFRGLIEEVEDEDVEGLPAHCRSIDLDEPPRLSSFIAQKNDVRKSMRFRTREWCGIFTEAWLGASQRGIPELLAGGSWIQINFVLAEECIRQATAQMHHLEAGAMDNVYATRRLVQAVFHGLMSLGDTNMIDSSSQLFKFGLSALTLPTEPGKRYRYLYIFLYRHCVEEGQWRLGRAFGRSDVRLDLLTMFVARDKGQLMVTGVSEENEAGLLPLPYQVEQPALPITDPVLRCDLLEALGRAGLDHGGLHGRRATEWALSTLPGWRIAPPFGDGGKKMQEKESYKINALLPARGGAYYLYAEAALRLRLDFLQSSGAEERLAIAKRLCDEQLDRIGFGTEFLDGLSGGLKKVVEMVWKGGDGAAASLDNILNEALKKLLKQTTSKAAQQGVADVLARLGKITATRAHALENSAERMIGLADLNRENSVILEFANASAVCWLSDRLRSDSGADPDIGLTWPVARGRSLRYYVRVFMKLARLIMEGNPNPANTQTWDFVAGLLGHARNRLGVYTRHHFRYRRERVSMLLLDSARVRSWVRVNLEMEQANFDLAEKEFYERTLQIAANLKQIKIEYSKHGIELRKIAQSERGAKAARLNLRRIEELERLRDEGRKQEILLLGNQEKYSDDFKKSKNLLKTNIFAQHDILRESIFFVGEAETLLLSLGFQPPHARRLYLERIKNAAALVRITDLCRNSGGDVDAQLAVEARAHLTTAKASLSALHDVSRGSEFWKGIYTGQAKSIAKLQQIVNSWALRQSSHSNSE